MDLAGRQKESTFSWAEGVPPSLSEHVPLFPCVILERVTGTVLALGSGEVLRKMAETGSG